jgi:HEAT repeat protein
MAESYNFCGIGASSGRGRQVMRMNNLSGHKKLSGHKLRHFNYRYAKILVLILLLFGTCAGCIYKDPLEAKVEKLDRSLGDEDLNVSYASAYALIDIGEPSVDCLLESLKDEDPQVRSLSAYALGRIEDPRALKPLIEALEDPEPEVRKNSAVALGDLNSTEAVGPLLKLLNNETNDDVRSGVIYSLGSIGDPKAASSIIKFFGDEELGSSAATAVGELGDEETVKKLLPFLKNRDPEVRIRSISALGTIRYRNIKNQEAVQCLIEMLNDRAAEVRKEAAFTLRFFDEPEETALTEQPLINALGDSDHEVQKAAISPLKHIKSKKAVPSLEKLLEDKNQNLKITAINALGEIGDPESLDSLSSLLRDKDWPVRRELASSLTEIGGSKAVDSLIFLLGDENYRVRQNAANGLGELGDKKAVGPLLKALETEREKDVRIAEVQALGELGGNETLETLSRISTDAEEYRNVRAAAEEAMKKIKT